MKTLWKGTLHRDGRAPEPFAAEIVDMDGHAELIERRGIDVLIVSPFMVSGESWMNAMVELARGAG